MNSPRRPRAVAEHAALFLAVAAPLLSQGPVGAQDRSGVEALAAATRASIAVVKTTGRTGEDHGLGTGFVIGEDGLVATNFHVIGEGRDFRVEFADGRSFRPREIVAVDRHADLAVVRIESEGLSPLQLGDSDRVAAGQTAFAVGNPLGLEFSVTQGVVAALRELEGRPMIQIAIPIEPGSSGSPLLDLQGRVIGILAIKSAGALGFAVPVNKLRALLVNPRPISIEKWRKVGALDQRDWETVLGGRWRQRAGEIVASESGSGFGGRMICLAKRAVPTAFDLEVDVRLEDESGAAGLAFHSDGQHNHYGFYPTAGALRLTRFEGPSVFQWTILETIRNEAYRPGDWNRIRVRVDGDHLTCFVNGTSVIDLNDGGLTGGQIGLVKFREPGARFRNLRVAPSLRATSPSAATVARVSAVLESLPDGAAPVAAIDSLADLEGEATAVLRLRAEQLERDAKRLRDLADKVHQREIIRELTERLVPPVQKTSKQTLLDCALLVALLDNPAVDRQAYRVRMERMAQDLEERFPPEATDDRKLDHLIEYLFTELGFRGSNAQYHHRSNSYINEVLDDREGLPIALSVVCIELASRVGLDVRGLDVPRHFLAAYRPGKPGERIIDAFAGQLIDRDAARTLTGARLDNDDFTPAGERAIITRMLRNLRGAAERERDSARALRYLDTLIAIEENPVYSRGSRAMLHYQNRRYEAAAADLDWLIEREPPGIDLDALRRMRDSLRQLGI